MKKLIFLWEFLIFEFWSVNGSHSVEQLLTFRLMTSTYQHYMNDSAWMTCESFYTLNESDLLNRVRIRTRIYLVFAALLARRFFIYKLKFHQLILFSVLSFNLILDFLIWDFFSDHDPRKVFSLHSWRNKFISRDNLMTLSGHTIRQTKRFYYRLLLDSGSKSLINSGFNPDWFIWLNRRRSQNFSFWIAF